MQCGRGVQGEGAGPSPLPDLSLLAADAGRITQVALPPVRLESHRLASLNAPSEVRGGRRWRWGGTRRWR